MGLMGTFSVGFTVRHPVHPHQQLELEGLVDTGALFTQIPAEVLARIGIGPVGTRAVHYAYGPGSLMLVGATTLETLGFGVDSVQKKLIPIEAPMAAAHAAI